ncbi:hypothetical protein ASPWEDRAFT_25867 [Aspergillus wentii DTO 134E9]|uniref:NACHT domain-containing protein n=1 Tax=Aspergillus wentii DTO 134E9 TaxID=1073089 RepID=A0A1L9RN72_ASPWE|nr:uncharacterized protein ASPWEDRAFT_25867 [Aspergillus wentii DTO 134E9]KAI9926047.1 hypothetical protein MW887_004506 [Aspergillus wentii]OJJ36390.1 hypothetical protein ASPWEDRAFT_25867 [Aspergillus wentii DTO 134E9]
MDGLSAAANAFAVIQLAASVAGLCAKYAAGVRDARRDISRLQVETEALQRILKGLDETTIGRASSPSSSTSDDLAFAVQQCQFTLSDLVARLDPPEDSTGKRLMSRFGLRALKWPLKNHEVDKIIDALSRHKTTIVLALTREQRESTTAIEKAYLTDRLPVAEDAAFNSHLWEQKPRCLEGTRASLVTQIKIWSQGPWSEPIFWLRGMAGTGKSTVALTIAHHLHENGLLGGSFFFSRGRGDLGSARKLFTTIASQLAAAAPGFKATLSAILSESPNIIRDGLQDQWNKLIIQPLNALPTTEKPKTCVMIIDALDECDDEDAIRLLLRLLPQIKLVTAVRLRILITSRPESLINLGFRRLPQDDHRDFALHEIEPDITEKDISHFLSTEFETIRLNYEIEQEWPDIESVQLLVKKSSCLFIYAATVSRFVQTSKYSHPEERLTLLLEGSIFPNSPEGQLDAMYMQILKQSVLGDSDGLEKEELAKHFREIVGSIVVLFDALDVCTLCELIGHPEKRLRAVLSNLHSVLDVPVTGNRPIQLLHPSFRDFLTNQKRCTDELLWTDEKSTHKDLFMKCMDVLSQHLKSDICDLKYPGTLAKDVKKSKIDSVFPSFVQYACRYWIDHLIKTEITNDCTNVVHDFMETHFLHWLEGLSLMGLTAEGVLMLSALEKAITALESRTLEMIQDAKRFALSNKPVIEEAPLQIYSSALLFTPENSLIRRCYESYIPAWISQKPKVSQNWSSLLQTIDCGSRLMKHVSISPDGKLIASSALRGEVKLWYTATGAPYCVLGNSDLYIADLTFTPDSSALLITSDSSIVRCNIPTGETSVMSIPQGSGTTRGRTALSSDCSLLALKNGYSQIEIWDMKAESMTSTFMDPDSSLITGAAFSPDGKQLATANHKGHIYIRQLAAGLMVQNLWTNEGNNSIAFSTDGQFIISWSSQQLGFKLWNCSTWEMYNMETGNVNILNVAFSPKEGLIACVCTGDIVKIFNATTRQEVGCLTGHLGYVTDIAFTPDGKSIASVSHDGTLKIWDSIPEGAIPVNDSLMTADQCEISFDGRFAVSSSVNGTVRIRNRATGSVIHQHEYREYIRQLVFSPDNTLIAVNPDYSETTVVDIASGRARFSIGIADDIQRRDVAFSPDSKLVAYAQGHSIIVKKTLTGEEYCTLHEDRGGVMAIAFSPDGNGIASGSTEHTMRVWSIAAKEKSYTLEVTVDARLDDGYPFADIKFSSDGKLVACVFPYSSSVTLWEPITGEVRSYKPQPNTSVGYIAISPDKKLIAALKKGGLVDIWDIATGDRVRTCGIEHQFPYHIYFDSIYFTPDAICLKNIKGLWSHPLSDESGTKSDSANMHFTGTWIVWRGQNILRLPPGYRDAVVAVRGDVIVLENGNTAVIEFDRKELTF